MSNSIKDDIRRVLFYGSNNTVKMIDKIKKDLGLENPTIRSIDESDCIQVMFETGEVSHDETLDYLMGESFDYKDMRGSQRSISFKIETNNINLEQDEYILEYDYSELQLNDCLECSNKLMFDEKEQQYYCPICNETTLDKHGVMI